MSTVREVVERIRAQKAVHNLVRSRRRAVMRSEPVAKATTKKAKAKADADADGTA
jgi:hypothetical protein